MNKKYFITRADDAGSSRSANKAIKEAAGAGFIKNISVMAPGPYVDEAAGLLAGHREICFGIHTTFNAEWDRVKWGPVGKSLENTGLLDANNNFPSHPDMFKTITIHPEAMLKEMNAQLEKLHKAGFDIRYADSHMFWEMYVDGMDEAFKEWTKKKGLIDHMYYYGIIEGIDKAKESREHFLEALGKLPGGQYFYLSHPAFDSEEMRMTGNRHISGEKVAAERNLEAELLKNPQLVLKAEQMGVSVIRYDEAAPMERGYPAGKKG